MIDVFNIKGDSGNAFDKAQEYLARTGPAKIDAFVCLEASAGKDVATVFKNDKATDRLLIAMDVDPDTLQTSRMVRSMPPSRRSHIPWAFTA